MSRTAYHLALAGLALLVIPVTIIAFNWAGEDCFITYRYAENLAEGHGAVFNTTSDTPEERVEGYSNPTMMLMLAGVHRLGGSTIYGSRWIAALSASATIILLGLMALSLSGEGRTRAWALLPAAMYALQPVVHYQIGRALEATLITLFLTLAAHLFIQRRMLLASVALALTTWSRPEAFLYVGPFLAAFAIEWWLNRSEEQRRPIRALAAFILPWLIATAAMFIGRRLYYGHWMPNSVALKTTPGAFGSSLPLVRDFIVSWSFLPLLAPFAAAGLRGADPVRRRTLLICALLIAHQLAFIVAIGDVPASPFRHFVPLIPFACLLIAEAVALACTSFSSRALAVYAVAILMALNIYTVSNGDATRTRLHVRLKEFVRGYNGSLNNPFTQFGFHWNWFHSPAFRVDAEAGRWVWANLPPDILIAGDQMGQFAYYGRQPMLDMFGLMDEHIGRTAHLGLDVDYVLAREPECVVFIWPGYGDDYTPDQAALRADPRFDERYRLRWRLTQDLGWIEMNEFHVFVRRGGRCDDGQPAETVILPGDEEMTHKYWRIRDW